MILRALVQRYEDTQDREDAVPFGWEIRDAAFSLELDENGNLYNLRALEESKGKQKVRPNYLLPREPAGRTSGIKPAFLCDNSQYVFGLSEKANDRAKKYFEEAKALYVRLLSGVESPFARAVLRFYENWNPQDAAGHPLIAPLLADKKDADAFLKGRFVFRLEGQYVHADAALKRVWDAEYPQKTEEQIRCLVTGEQDTLIKLHGKVALPGVSMSKVPLVSVNAEGFASYGKTKDDPAAQVGKRAEFAYVTALNALLKDDTHHIRLGIDTLVYWAEGGGEQEAAGFSLSAHPKEEDSKLLDEIMQRVESGRKVNLENCDMERPFYLLCLSPNAGRISVRFFHQSTFGDVLLHNMEHHRDFDIVMSAKDKKYLSPQKILDETKVVKDSKYKPSPLLGGQLLHSILSGHAYPATLYSAILTRTRAGEGVNRVKAGVIKAFLLRKSTAEKEREVLTVALNEQSGNQPYVLGRLFATLEELQRVQADTKLNRTIYDSYFTSASSHPLSVFTSILQLSSHHMAKLRKTKPGYAVILDKRMNELMGKLAFEENSSPFPATLGYEEQGLFILGYYHQRAFRKDKNEEASDNEQQL